MMGRRKKRREDSKIYREGEREEKKRGEERLFLMTQVLEIAAVGRGSS